MKVLFVDDEQSVLDGLRHGLFRHRKRWDLHFCTSAVEALILCAQMEFDVVVSDMRMPRMNGAELLTKLRKACPATMRLILSGQADQEALQKAIPVAHQILAKPCPPDVLIGTLEQVERTIQFLNSSPLQFPIGDLCDLPARPKTYLLLSELLERDPLDVDAATDVIKSDIVLSTRVLSLINAPYFGSPEEVKSISGAIRLLGPALLRILIVSMEFATDDRHLPGLIELEDHSLTVAKLMRAACPSACNPSLWFAAGLLHDIGKLVLGRQFINYSPSMTLEEERERFGVTHAQLGAHLLSSWGLPMEFVQIAAFHHATDSQQAHEAASVRALRQLEHLIETEGHIPSEAEFTAFVRNAEWSHSRNLIHTDLAS